MGTITDPERASTVADSISDALHTLADTEFAKFDDLALLAFGPILERITRLTHTAQLHLTGEIDTRRIAGAHGYPSTAALLRGTLQISGHDATTGATPPARSRRNHCGAADPPRRCCPASPTPSPPAPSAPSR